jgi:hypothetical protein
MATLAAQKIQQRIFSRGSFQFGFLDFSTATCKLSRGCFSKNSRGSTVPWSSLLVFPLSWLTLEFSVGTWPFMTCCGVLY